MPEPSSRKKTGEPKKILAQKKKLQKPTAQVDSVNGGVYNNISAQVDDVIKQAFLRFYDNATLKQSKVKDLEHLDTIAAEFLHTYMILGYDLNGEKVAIMHAKTPHDKDALVEHLRTTLLGIIN
jgi:hypothetical protein